MVEAATARYASGQPMDPDPRLPENLRMMLAAFDTPANLPFARELWNEDAADSLPLVRVPTLVVIGGKDLQVDARIDGGHLQEAAGGMGNVTFAFPANANHVLKDETRSTAEIAASGDARYNDPDTHLDPETAGLILSLARWRPFRQRRTLSADCLGSPADRGRLSRGSPPPSWMTGRPTTRDSGHCRCVDPGCPLAIEA